MEIIDIFLLICLLCVCVYGAVSDIRSGIISNRVLLPFACTGIALDAVNYLVFYKEYQAVFLVNFVLALVSSLFFYMTHIWAGGDSKMLMTVMLLYPVKYCYTYHGSKGTFYFVIMFSFAIGFLYLLFSSFVERIRKRKSIDTTMVIKFIKSFFVRYLMLTVYSALFTLLNRIVISKFFILNSLSISICYFVIPWIVAKFDFLQKRIIILLILGVDIILAVTNRIMPIDLNARSYIIILVSALIQSLMIEFNYETIKTEDVQKGMILSLPTTILFMNSRVKGLPKLSNEDLSSRLTEEEAASVRRWRTTSTGRDEIIIVRKIPFGIFISAGVFLYFILGVVYG